MEASVPHADRMAPRHLALLAGATTVVLWASAFVGVRAAGEELSGGPLALARLLVATAALGAVVLLRRERLPRRAQLPGLLACGLLWFGAYNVALNEAERRVDAGTAAMLVNVGPVLIALLAGVVLKEGFPRRLLTGCAVAFAGVVVIGVATSSTVTASVGTALCLVAAATYAGGVVAQKPLLRDSSPLAVTFCACAIGAAACVPFGPALVREAGDAGTGTLAWAVYLGVFPTAVAFTTWAYALRHSTAGRTGAMTYLVPPLVIVFAWVLLGETPPLGAVAGGVLCITGAAVAQGRLRRRTRRGSATTRTAATAATRPASPPTSPAGRRA